MATRKRRHTRRRRAASNPPTRRRTAKVRSRRRVGLFTRRRRRNPTTRRIRARRRNPMRAGLFTEGTKLAISGALIGFTQPLLRGFVGQWIGSSPIANAGLTFGTAYALSFLSRLTNFTRKLEDPLLLSGATIAVAQLISSYVLPLLRPAAATNAGMSGRYGPGMRGIAAVPSTNPPGYAPLPPMPPPQANAGMQGIAAYPTPGAFRR